MSVSNCFSWQNFKELADIDSHIVFVKQLLDKYKWDDNVRKKVERQIVKITEKQDDNHLNISVIGEFSSGKSSFINALLRYDLLSINVLQGTTVAITIMEYSPRLFIKVVRFDGIENVCWFSHFEAFKTELQRLTTDSANGRKIQYITVGLPSPTLKKGFRIIDTPGTNSIHQWHEDVTKRAINEYSDMSIIVVDACRPLPISLCSFVEENLTDVLSNCVFVLTKTDLIKSDERSLLVKYVKNKISDDFELDDTLVLPYTPTEIVNRCVSGLMKMSDSDLLQESLQNEERLLVYANHQRAMTQAKSLIGLTRSLYEDIGELIDKTLGELYAQSELHKRTRNTDLKPFVKSQISKRLNEFREEVTCSRTDTFKRISEIKSTVFPCIEKKIRMCKSLDSLEGYLRDGLSSDCEQFAMCSLAEKKNFYRKATMVQKRQVKIFQKAFKQEFENLRIISFNFAKKTRDVSEQDLVDKVDFASAIEYTNKEATRAAWMAGGTFAIGALVGTIIAPGLGTIIGGAIASMFGPSFEERLRRAKVSSCDNIRPSVDSYTSSVINRTITDIDGSIKEMENCIEVEIMHYYSAYKTEVSKQMASWKQKKNELDGNIYDMKASAICIKQQQRIIESLLSVIENKNERL